MTPFPHVNPLSRKKANGPKRTQANRNAKRDKAVLAATAELAKLLR